MNRDIIQKLNKHILGGGLACEAGVVYFLVQLVKLVERDSLRRDYPHLIFYRNWAVHSRLDRAKVLVKKFDKVIEQGEAEGQDGRIVCTSLTQEMQKSLTSLCVDIRTAFASLKDAEYETRFDEHLLRPEATWWDAVGCGLLAILADIPAVAQSGHIRAVQIVDPSPQRAVLWISGESLSVSVKFSLPLWHDISA